MTLTLIHIKVYPKLIDQIQGSPLQQVPSLPIKQCVPFDLRIDRRKDVIKVTNISRNLFQQARLGIPYASPVNKSAGRGPKFVISWQ